MPVLIMITFLQAVWILMHISKLEKIKRKCCNTSVPDSLRKHLEAYIVIPLSNSIKQSNTEQSNTKQNKTSTISSSG